MIKAGKRLTPLLHGGGQENNKRSTTENLPAIAATAKAMRLTLTDDSLKRKKVGKMKAVIYNALKAYDKVILFSEMEHFAPNILTFGIRGVRGEVVVHGFENHEIYISTTSLVHPKRTRQQEL